MKPIRRSLARLLTRLFVLGALTVASGCTVMSVSGKDEPPSVRSRGLVDGHLALGINDEDRLLYLEVLDGRSPGAVAELVVWKLFRVEVGLAGAAVGIGPIDLALGTLFYEPRMPSYPKRESGRPAGESNADGIDAALRHHDR